jgi:glycosyltransferase involved in cell wall biosynthesis
MSNQPFAQHVVHFSSVHQVGDVRIFLKECRSLAAAGYRVTLVARGEKSDVVDGVRRIGLSHSSSGGRIGRMVLGTVKVARQAWRQNADLYHFHDPELLPVGLLFRISGKRVIYDAHENIRDQIVSKPYIPAWARKPLSKLVGLIEDFAIRRFDGVVTATPRIAETLQTANTVTAANYPVAEEIAYQTGEVSRNLEKIVFVGGFTFIRGAREMVEAIELVNQQRPCKLVICGVMPAAVRSEVENLPGWEFVEDLGWQERDRTQSQMAAAACGLCVFHPEPNHVEAVPNKLFEYMAAGLPVVASNFPFWRQFVEDVGSGVMVDPLNPQSIADAILEIISNPARVTAMGAAGSDAVKSQFKWDAESEKLLALYSTVFTQ